MDTITLVHFYDSTCCPV